MIRVTIEMLPHGMELGRHTIGVIEIANDGTGTVDVGNYDVKLTKEPPIAKTRGTWRKGVVRNFPRRTLGPYDLLYRALTVTLAGRGHP
jgi:hypothetical protein